MIKSYNKRQSQKAFIVSFLVVLAVGVFYALKVVAVQSGSPILAKIKNEKSAIARLEAERQSLLNKIQEATFLDSERAALVAKHKKYEIDVAKERNSLVEIFSLLSKEYSLFDVSVSEVAEDAEFLNLINVKLHVSSSDASHAKSPEKASSYIKKMRELVVLYLYKNKDAFSMYGEVDKIGDDTIMFKIIKK